MDLIILVLISWYVASKIDLTVTAVVFPSHHVYFLKSVHSGEVDIRNANTIGAAFDLHDHFFLDGGSQRSL